MAKTESIYPKKVGDYLALRTIEKMKILGAFLELPAKQHYQSSPFASKLGQIGKISSAV